MSAILEPPMTEETKTVSEVTRILIVDDDAASRFLMKYQLKGLGYTLLEVASGNEAIEQFEELAPDLILIDVNMPGMDGFETTQELRRRYSDRYIAILFVSGTDNEIDIVKGIDAGGDDFLFKPVIPTVLHARIRAALRHSKTNKQLHDQNLVLAQRQICEEREREQAQELFARVVHLGCLDDANVDYVSSAMSGFNGDMLLAERTPYGALRVMLGDFTGHGLPAAVGTLPTAEIFYGMTKKGFHVAEIAKEINKKLFRILPRGIFCAATIFEINNNSSQLTVWNGGLPHLLVFDTTTGDIQRKIGSTHLALGVCPPKNFDSSVECHELLDTERLLAYTDGIVETENPSGELYDDKRLVSCLQTAANGGSLLKSILDDVAMFQKHAAQTDDYTLIELPCDLPNKTIATGQSCVAQPKAALPWSQQLTLQNQSLAEVDPIPLMLDSLMQIQGLSSFREQLFTIMTELYVNALDHGVLKLVSALKKDAAGFAEYFRLREERLQNLDGVVHLQFKHVPTNSGGRLTIRIEDSGDGFDTSVLLSNIEEHDGFSSRGIALVRGLCDSLDYSEGGRVVEAVFSWSMNNRS